MLLNIQYFLVIIHKFCKKFNFHLRFSIHDVNTAYQPANAFRCLTPSWGRLAVTLG